MMLPSPHASETSAVTVQHQRSMQSGLLLFEFYFNLMIYVLFDIIREYGILIDLFFGALQMA